MTRSWTMPQRIVAIFLVLLLLCTALLVGITYWATPTVVIQNHSWVTVHVEAYWGTDRKQFPAITPEAKRTFKVTGESAMEFVATYPDGRHVTSLPMYFTTATTVTAVVTDSGVEVTAEL